jgi:hypothetical protein
MLYEGLLPFLKQIENVIGGVGALKLLGEGIPREVYSHSTSIVT